MSLVVGNEPLAALFTGITIILSLTYLTGKVHSKKRVIKLVIFH